ncbi:MAG: hypothetical protein AB7T63_00655 [Planctomycetota bacterium]
MPGLALTLVLLASGAAALLHESAWFRLLTPLLGAGALPAATVAAGALLGMAAGARWGGRLADRTGRPLAVLVAAEVLAAGLGVLVPPALDRLGASSEGPAAWALATILLAVVALPWGASVPAALRALRPEPAAAGRAFKRLYAWNTLGAVAGIVVGAAFAFEALGNRGSVRVASGLQLVAAVLALTLVKRSRSTTQTVSLPVTEHGPRPGGSGVLLIASTLAGAVGVVVQVAWMRRLTPHLGATYPVFAAVLGVHLVGIALGTWLFGPRTARAPRAAIFGLTWLAGAIVATTPWLLPHVLDAVEDAWWDSSGSPLTLFLWRSAIATVLVLPAVAPASALLAWWVRLREPPTRNAGSESGGLLAANAVGGAAGGFLAALVLIPAVGTAGALVVAAGAILVAGALSLRGAARGATAVAGLAVIGAAFVRLPSDQAAVDRVGQLYSASSWRPDDVRTRHAREGVVASTLVRDAEGRIEFWVEGSYEASTAPTDLLHLGLLGHLPLVLFEARADRAPHVALVGLGAGYTAQASDRHHPASLVVYELEDDVVDAATWFRDVGGGLPASAELIVADGRRAVLQGDRPLDVLSSDPVHPALAGSAWLYSADWWRGAMERLPEDGLLVQWMPLYHLVREDLALAFRTFAASVPHPYLFLIGSEALLVGANTPLVLSLERVREALARDSAAPLAEQGFRSAGRLLSMLVLDGEGMRNLVGPGEINTDDRLLLELRSGWREANDPAATFAWLHQHQATPASLLDAPPDAMFEREVEAGRELHHALEAWQAGGLADARERFRDIALLDPANVLARRLRDDATALLAFDLLHDAPEEAEALARELLARDTADALVRLDAAEVLLALGHTDEARAVAAAIAAKHDYPRARRLAATR